MKVKELIELLKTLPETHEVIVSSDSEGNNFSPLADYGLGVYMKDAVDDGSFYNVEDFDRDDNVKENAVVFWPTR